MSGRAGFTRIGIVGLGLIGGSVALAVRRAWPAAALAGVDADAAAVREARARGVVDEASCDLDALDKADVIVLAAPVRANAAVLAALAARGGVARREDVLLTDTGSTKRDILAAARRAGVQNRFVGGHPLAGAAVAGLTHARASLFDERPWLLTPDGDTPSEHLARLERFVAALGAVPTVVSADGHDRVMAAVSHLPQLVASALMQVAGEMAGADGLAFAGKGLTDTTRLASSPPAIWRDVCAANADHLAPAIGRLIEVLARLRADLPRGDALEEVFTSARHWRRAIEPQARGVGPRTPSPTPESEGGPAGPGTPGGPAARRRPGGS